MCQVTPIRNLEHQIDFQHFHAFREISDASKTLGYLGASKNDSILILAYSFILLECARPICNLSAEAEARLQKTFYCFILS